MKQLGTDYDAQVTRFAAGTDIVWTQDVLQIRTRSAVANLRDASTTRVLTGLVYLLRRGATYQELVTHCVEYSAQDITDLITLLLTEGILVAEREEDGWYLEPVSLIDSHLAASVEAKITQANAWNRLPKMFGFPSRSGRVNQVYLILAESLGVLPQEAQWRQLPSGDSSVFGLRIDRDYYLFSSDSRMTLSPLIAFERLVRGSTEVDDIRYGWELNRLQPSNGATDYFNDEEIEWLSEGISRLILLYARREIESIEMVLCVDDGSITPLPLLRPQIISNPPVDEQESPKAFLSRLKANLVGTGSIIATIHEIDYSDSEGYQPTMYVSRARYVWPRLLPDVVRSRDWASGSDVQRPLATLKAIVEGVERFCSGCFEPHDLTPATLVELGQGAIDPRETYAYLPEQLTGEKHTFHTFDSEETYQWVAARDMFSGVAKYLLVDCVYFPLSRHELGRGLCVGTTSSGVAAHRSWDDAVSAALYELCERDALMVIWYNRLMMPRIDVGTLPIHLQRRTEAIVAQGRKIHIVDCTLDIAPVFLVCLLSETEMPTLVCGMGCHHDPALAIEKAMNEAEMMLASRSRIPSELSSMSAQDVRSPEDHCTYYASPERAEAASFLYGSTDMISIPERSDDIVSVLQRMRLAVYLVDLTSKELVERGVDLKVVRAYVPGLVPISFGFHREPMASRRLVETPSRLGLESVTNQKGPSFELPHPLA